MLEGQQYAQLEEQNQAVVVSENAPQADSTPIKKQHGGKRAGAGRKPNLVKRLVSRLSPLSAGIEDEKLFDHFWAGPGEPRRHDNEDHVCQQAPGA